MKAVEGMLQPHTCLIRFWREVIADRPVAKVERPGVVSKAQAGGKRQAVVQSL